MVYIGTGLSLFHLSDSDFVKDIVEESKTFDEAPEFEHTVTRSDSFSSCPQADLTITVVDSRQ